MKEFLGSSVFTWVLNTIFFALILFAFLRAKISLKGNNQNYVEYAPSLMTSLGLFGTFLGIFIGLLHFDAKHIDGSIEQLLSGLQTAFVTSLIGMFFAIWFKIIQTSYLDKKNPESDEIYSDDISPKDIFAVLSKQHTELSSIAKGIGGNDERSMVGQLQMLRTDITDFRSGLFRRQESFEDKLWKQMHDFADLMSKSATQQVIEALKEVIVEFNQKLTEQFGDNFKRLDESVKKLVDWQANYMVQMEEMTKLYAQGVDSITATKAAVESIRMETARIPADMQMLGEVMTVNQHQIAELSRHLDAFVKMRDQAIVAVPQIQAKLEEVGQQILSGAREVNLVLKDGSHQFEDSVTQVNQSMTTTAREIATQCNEISEELKNSMELLGMNTEHIRTGITAVISTAMESVEQSTQNLLTKSQETTKSVLASVQQSVQASVDISAQARNESLHAADEVNRTVVQSADRSMQAVEKQIQEAVNRTNAVISTAMESVEQSTKNLLTKSQETTKSVLASVQQSVQASVDISAQARNESLHAADEVNRTVVQSADRSMQAVEKQIQEAVNRTNEAVNSQLRQLDEALSRQLNAALQELGSALATIARHLAESYQRNSQRHQP